MTSAVNVSACQGCGDGLPTGSKDRRVNLLARQHQSCVPCYDKKLAKGPETTTVKAVSAPKPKLTIVPTGDQVVKQAGAATGEDSVPPPTNPTAVAEKLLPAWMDKDKILTLRHWRGSWMNWEGSYWRELEDQKIKADLYGQLKHARYEHQVKGDIELREWSPNRRKVADLLEAVAAETYLSRDIDAPAWIGRGQNPLGGDRDPIVACANGLLRVTGRKLEALTPEFFNLTSVPFDYDPDATAPTWQKFLDQSWPEDHESIDALQEFFGYVASGRTDLQKIMMVVGPTRSGKGTISRVLSSLIGKGNVAGPTLASLATNFGLQPLLGKSLAVISDARLGGGNVHQVVERLLTISGEDMIDIDRKNRDQWTGRLPTRFMISSNELPSFGDMSGAIAGRFIVLMMRSSWLGQEDPGLFGKLSEELPGILNWALDGLARLTERGRFTEPSSSADAVMAMKDAAAPMSAFVRDHCDTGPAYEVSIPELYEAWRTWCEDNGRERPGSAQTFGRSVIAVVPQVVVVRPRVDGRQVKHYAGIALKKDGGDDRPGQASQPCPRCSGPMRPIKLTPGYVRCDPCTYSVKVNA